jgi:toluene monooxygenase system ferredoxin subunit
LAEPVVREDELWIGEMRGVVLRGQPLLVVRTEEKVCVFRDRCPHQGYPLSDGTLHRGVITCRAHRHTFDATTGQGINPQAACLSALPTRVEGGQVLVELSKPRQEPREPATVGPVLLPSELGRAVLSAIRADNPGVQVQDRGAYLRVLASGRCAVTRRAIEQQLGQAVRLPADLELCMPSFKGRLRVDAERVIWEAGEA